MDLIQELRITYEPMFKNKSDSQIAKIFKEISQQMQIILELMNLNSKKTQYTLLFAKMKFGKYFSMKYLKKALQRAKITKKYTIFNTLLYGYYIFHASKYKNKNLVIQYSIAEDLGFFSLADMFEEIYSLDFKKYIDYSKIFIQETDKLFDKYLKWFRKRFNIDSFEINMYLRIFSKKDVHLFRIADQTFNIFEFMPEIIKKKKLNVSFQINKNHIPKTFIMYQETGEKIYFLGDGVVLLPILFHEMGHVYQISIIKENNPFWELYIADRNCAEEFTSQLFEISFLWSEELKRVGFQEISEVDVLKFFMFHRILEIRKMIGRVPIDYLCMKAKSIEELIKKQGIIKSEYEHFLKQSLGFDTPSNYGIEDIGIKEYITKENAIFYVSGLFFIGDFLKRFDFDWQNKPEALTLLHEIILNETHLEKKLSDDPCHLIGILHRLDEYIVDYESKHS